MRLGNASSRWTFSASLGARFGQVHYDLSALRHSHRPRRWLDAWDSHLARHNKWGAVAVLNGLTFTELTTPSFPTNSRLASLFWNVRFGAGVTVYR